MIVTRQQPLDYKEVFETIVKVTSEYLINSKIQKMVIGLSGGLDSTVDAAICHEVSKRTGIQLIGVSLPCSTNKEDEITSADSAGNEFCDTFIVKNIQEGFESISDMCSDLLEKNETPISKGNIKARLRMIVLYDIASRCSGIVIDNDMLTENFLGFYTVNGDVCDLNPIANLWKHEVYELAKWMSENVYKDSEALKRAIEITPTDGNGVSASDMDQIMPGYTYNDVDDILMKWVTLDDSIKEFYLKNGINRKGTVFAPLCDKYGEENVMKVILRCVRSEYKRLPHPIPVDIFRGTIEKKRCIE